MVKLFCERGVNHENHENIVPRKFGAIQYVPDGVLLWWVYIYRISSNSSRPSNRPRGNSIVSEIQRALELTEQFN